MSIRTILVAFAVFVAPQVAAADYVDAITNKLNDGCTMEKYMKTVEEFHGVMKSQGYTYRAEIMVPVTSQQLDVVYWVGRTTDMATFGAEYSKWLKALENPSSPESKVNAKLTACSTNVNRSGLLTQ